MRSIATAACVIAVLVPFLVGMAISLGVQREAELSVEFGADLYLSASSFGRPAPVPLSALDKIRGMSGVKRVVPRIIGPVTLGRDAHRAVVVGVPSDAIPDSVRCVRGRLFAADHELVIGSGLATRLNLALDDRVLPFYRSSQGERTGKVVGMFETGSGLWESSVLFMSLDTAAAVFDRPGLATDFAIVCHPGYAEAVHRQILQSVTFPSRSTAPLRPRVISREQLAARLPQGMRQRGGIFNLHFLLAFTVAILVVLVTSGFGLAERRREISILKALGWETDELLVRSLVESLLLSVSSAAAAIVIAYVWLRWLNGVFIASVLLPDWHWRPDAPIPFDLTPWPAFWSLVVSFVVVMCGSLVSTWRAACAPPLAGLK
jgi:ABC-type lipoprotein release transport system permease subunit